MHAEHTTTCVRHSQASAAFSSGQKCPYVVQLKVSSNPFSNGKTCVKGDDAIYRLWGFILLLFSSL